MTKRMRKIVKIDEDKCNGCGLCIPNCAEGAIQIIDGKAKLLADNLCDGIGNCLGTCPLDAIQIIERPADEFDEEAVEEHLASEGKKLHAAEPEKPKGGCPGSMLRNLKPQASGGCPGSRMREMKPAAPASTTPGQSRQSQLGHWPVQLKLLPQQGHIWEDADVLIAADCVAFAMPDFHERLLAGKTVGVGCPKLDDVGEYADKLATIFANNNIKSVTVAHMEVPCCNGIVFAVKQALAVCGKDIPLHDITVGIDGSVKSES